MRSTLVLLVPLSLSLLGACASVTQHDAVAAPSPAPAKAQDDPLALAAAQFKQKEWNAAIPLFEQALAHDPAQPTAWAQLAYCEHSLGHYDKSLAAWTKSLELKPAQPVVQYNIACANARLDKRDAALDALDKSVALGFNDAKQLETDTDLDALRPYSRFQIVLAKLKQTNGATKTPTPPAEMEQFAFWVGEWDVFTKDDRVAGKSVIERILGGFAIQENWTGTGGMSGVSLNTYDPRTKKWRQHWVDDRGGVLEFEDGEFKNDSLTFVGKAFDAAGTPLLHRMTFTNLGERGVRQFGEQSNDGGRTWTVGYELFYKPRAKQ